MATDNAPTGEEDAGYQEYLLDHAQRQLGARAPQQTAAPDSSSPPPPATQQNPAVTVGEDPAAGDEEVPVSIDSIDIQGATDVKKTGPGSAEVTIAIPTMRVPGFRKHILKHEKAKKDGGPLSYDEWQKARDEYLENQNEEAEEAEAQGAAEEAAADQSPKETPPAEEDPEKPADEQEPSEEKSSEEKPEAEDKPDTAEDDNPEVVEQTQDEGTKAPTESTTPPLIPEAGQPAIASAMNTPGSDDRPTGLGRDIGEPPAAPAKPSDQAGATPQQTVDEKSTAADMAQQRSENAQDEKEDDSADNVKAENPLATDIWVTLFVETHPLFKRYTAEKTLPLKKGIDLMHEAGLALRPFYAAALLIDVGTTLTTISGFIPIIGVIIAAFLAIPVYFFYVLFGQYLSFTKSGVLARVENACTKAEKDLREKYEKEKKKRTLLGRAKTAIGNALSRSNTSDTNT